MKRLFDYDAETGVREIFEATPDGFTIRTEQDCQPILDLNKAKQAMGRDFYASDPDMWKVAEIPIVVQMKWLCEYGVDIYNRDHWPAVKRLLNSSDWRHLKTASVII